MALLINTPDFTDRSNMKWSEEWFQQAEKRVVAGQGELVQKEMDCIERSGIPDKFLAAFARLYRRTGAPVSGVKTLFSTVKGEVASPTPEQTVEYACCLSRMGRGKEAIDLLKPVSESDQIQHALEIADIYFNVWDYLSGESLLSKALSQQPEGYKKRILQVNYLSALIALGRIDEASAFGKELAGHLKKEESFKLLGNTLELLGQCHLQKGQWLEAQKSLNESIGLLKSSGSLSSMLPEKWLVLGEMMFDNPSRDSIDAKINRIKNEARNFRHWESMRHIDLQVALHYKDSELFSRIYNTCPHSSFLKLLLDPHKQQFSVSHEVVWNSGDSFTELSLQEPLQGRSEKVLEPQQVLHKLLRGLFSDYYKPQTVFQLHLSAFPGEYFDPLSSADKTHKAIKRLRSFLKEAYPELELENNKAYGYRIRCTKGLKVFYPETNEELEASSADLHFLMDLKQAFGEKAFSRKDVDEKLGFNPRKSGRKLQQAVETGDLTCEGSGRSTRYKIAS